MRDDARAPAVSITALVTREVGAAVRASGGTASPYLAHGRLHRELDRLRDRLAQVAQRRPDLLTTLAVDLRVPATLDRVVAKVEDRAATMLDRRLEPDLQPSLRSTERPALIRTVDLGYSDDSHHRGPNADHGARVIDEQRAAEAPGSGPCVSRGRQQPADPRAPPDVQGAHDARHHRRSHIEELQLQAEPQQPRLLDRHRRRVCPSQVP